MTHFNIVYQYLLVPIFQGSERKLREDYSKTLVQGTGGSNAIFFLPSSIYEICKYIEELTADRHLLPENIQDELFGIKHYVRETKKRLDTMIGLNVT